MLRRAPLSFAVVLVLLLLPWGGRAAGEEPATKPPPKVDSAEDAKEALAIFKKSFAARGLRGEDKIAAKVFALRELAKVQHPTVVDALAKKVKNRNADIRVAALLQLKSQTALPGYAGKVVVGFVKRYRKDETTMLAILEVIRDLGYLGAKDVLAELMFDWNYPVAKNAFATIGELGDTRLIDTILKLAGERGIEKGSSWDGTSGTVDTGTAGDGDQRAANEAGGQGKGGAGGGGVSGKKGANAGRDLGPPVFHALYKLTGQKFKSAAEVREWVAKNRKQIDESSAAVEKRAKAQLAP